MGASEEGIGYRFLEHTTDALVEAWGTNLEEALESAAKALMDTILHVESVEEQFKDSIEVKGHDRESLLYNWLEAVLLKVAIEQKAYRSFQATVEHEDTLYRLKATAIGEPLQVAKHMPKTEVKAVTYHLMKIQEESKGTRVKFLLDI